MASFDLPFSDSITNRLRGWGITYESALYALHLAVQSAAAVAITFVVMRTLGMSEMFVGALSAVLVIQPSVGNTLSAAIDRALATFVGSVIGVLTIFAIPFGYGTAVSLAITMFVINLAAGFRPDWRYGVVAGVAIALGAESNAIDTALDRFLAIMLGGGIGVAVALLVWPETASRRTGRKLRTALHACADLLSGKISKAAGVAGDEDTDDARQRYTSAISEARTAADGVQLADSSPLEQRIDQVEKLYTSIVLIERIGDASKDSSVADHEDLQNALTDFRETACDVIKSIAEDAERDDGAFDALQSKLDQARGSVRQDSDDRFGSMLDNALAFALGEIALSLENLKNAYDEEYSGSVLDWSAGLARGEVRSPQIDLKRANPLQSR
ncbi:MAG: FUSC family protein [Pseudomonadota bacterium]